MQSYNENNVRNEIKRMVLAINDFLKHYERYPDPKMYKEKRLYLRWKRYSDPNNLNNDEKLYVQNNMLDVKKSYIGKMIAEKTETQKTEWGDNVRQVIKKFVEEYNNFVLTYARKPNYKIPDESPLYFKFRNYTSDKFSNKQEIEYIKNNLIKIEIRRSVLKFVKDFNEFVIEHKRLPSSTSKGEEYNLYAKWKVYSNPKNLSENDLKFIENNIVVNYITIKGTKKDNIRLVVKNFVQEYNNFITEKCRMPKSCAKSKFERNLYTQWLYYSNPKNIKRKESEYIEMLLVKRDEVSIYVKRYVEDYNNFVKKYNRHPQQNNSPEEANLYRRWLVYTKSKELNDKEIEYIADNLNDMSNVRSFIVNFVEKYNAFIKANNRKPSFYIKRDRQERNLAKQLYDIKNLRKLTESEVEYLKMYDIYVNKNNNVNNELLGI